MLEPYVRYVRSQDYKGNAYLLFKWNIKCIQLKNANVLPFTGICNIFVSKTAFSPETFEAINDQLLNLVKQQCATFSDYFGNIFVCCFTSLDIVCIISIKYHKSIELKHLCQCLVYI